MGEEDNKSQSGFALFTRANLRFLAIVTVVLVVVAIMANITNNNLLVIDTAEDVVDSTDDVLDDVNDLIEEQGADALDVEMVNTTLAEGIAREDIFAESEGAYLLLVTANNEILGQYNAEGVTSDEVAALRESLVEDSLRGEDGEYYEIAQDPVTDAGDFVVVADTDVEGWTLISSYPTAEIPNVDILTSTINLFDVSEAGSTLSVMVEDAVSYLNQNLSWLFRGLRWPIEQVISTIENGLLALPWIVVIAATAIVAGLVANRQTMYIATIGMFVIGLLGLWDRTMTTLAMLLTSMAFCIVVGIPLGIWAARNDRVNEIVRSVLDAMQTIHPFVYLVPIVVLFGIGKVPGTIATIIFALPPMVRLTNLGIRQVPEDVIEAARAFGSSDWQLLRDVQIPLALPSIMAGVNQTLMLSLSMVVIVALIAGQGLGEEIYRAIGRADTGRAVVAGVAVLLLAVVVDRVSQGRTGMKKREES